LEFENSDEPVRAHGNLREASARVATRKGLNLRFSVDDRPVGI
jgi:hypothetical protein